MTPALMAALIVGGLLVLAGLGFAAGISFTGRSLRRREREDRPDWLKESGQRKW